MERATHYRPRVGRETRLLITTAVLAVLALWMLARLRFPDQPADSRTMAGILSAPGSILDDTITTELTRVRGFLGASLMTVDLASTQPGGAQSVGAALRLGGDVAIVYIGDGKRLLASSGVTLIAHDTASGLAVVRFPADPAPSAPAPRAVAPPEAPEFLIATTVYPDGVTLRPVFVPAMARVDAPLWSSTAYAVPLETGLTPGAFLFTRDGGFAGLSMTLHGSPAFVPAETVLDEANRLIANPTIQPADYGVDTQELTPALGRALGSDRGVVVTWVDPDGPSGRALMVRDVIEAVDGQLVQSVDQWRRHVAHAQADTPVTLNVRRYGTLVDVAVTPTSASGGDGSDTIAKRPFGALLRGVSRRGVEVISVQPGSPAAVAGLTAGDLITAIGSIAAPTSAQVTRAVAALRPGSQALLSIERAGDHRLLVLEP